MADFQTGVPMDRVVPLVGMVPRYDTGTAPVLLRSTMVQTAWDLETRHGHVTQTPAQVNRLAIPVSFNIGFPPECHLQLTCQ